MRRFSVFTSIPVTLAACLLLAAPLVAQSGLDSDADGLPDAWELRFGLDAGSNAGSHGPGGDPDGDGLTNLQELAAGSHPRGFHRSFFAEGATGPFFDVRFALFNTGLQPAHVLLTYLRDDGQVFTDVLLLPPLSRWSADPESVAGLGDTAFATTVDSDERLVVDRTMSWDERHNGSHAETGLRAPATRWYLAEGATHSGFDLFYLLANPGGRDATVRVEFLRPEAPTIVKAYVVAARSRFNVWVDREDTRLASTDVSATIVSDLPIVVERAMYKNLPGQMFGAGHASAGLTTTATRWFLAEGATGPYFDLFVLLANPDTRPAEVTLTYLLPSGDRVTQSRVVPPTSRDTVWVDHQDARLENTPVSTIVESTNAVPIVVERAMWWPGPPAAWREAHDSAGATVTARRWALAEGEQGGPYNCETYVLVANTTARAGSVRVTLFFEGGGLATRTVDVAPASRYTVAVGAQFAEAEGRRFATLVESVGLDPVDVVVERAMYSDAGSEHWAAGTAALGAPLSGDPVDLASLGSDTVTVTASRPNAAEAGRTPGAFTFTRTGDAPITVVYMLAGTADEADYDPLPRTVTFAASQRTATVTVVPVDDAVVEGPETVAVTVMGSAQYVTASASRATIVVADNEPPVVPAMLVDAPRFLTQATFGPTTAEIARVQSMGYAAWIDEQMRMPASSFVGYLQQITDEYVDEPHVQEAWVQYSASAPDQLRQRVANALLEIMVVSNKNGLEGASWAHAAYIDVLLQHAFGSFRALLTDVTLNPAMGRFLDMLKNDKEDLSTGRRPNENYARELLQLFTIGKVMLNPDGSPRLDTAGAPIPAYGQAEVDGFSRVFTGWTFYQATPPYRFRASEDWRRPMVAVPSHHSPGTKALLNGVVLPAGQTPERDLADALDNVFSHPNVGPFIARRLIQRLVTSNPSGPYVARVAAVFNDNGGGGRGDLGAVVRTILLDPEARTLQTSREATFGKVREPMIRFITVMRAFGARARSGKYRIWDLDLDVGQGPFRAPSVFNFFSPDYRHPGEPADLGLVAPELQITNEDTVIVAANTMRRLAYDAYGCSDADTLRFDLTVEQGLAATPGRLVDHFDALLFAGGMSPGLRTAARTLVERLPADEPGWRVRAAINLLVNSPEFVVQK